MANSNDKQVKIQLAALNPYLETNFIENVSKEISGKSFILWGENNSYPDFLFDLYNTCTTLQTLCNGTADYVCGNEVICNIPQFQKQINKKGDTILDLVQRITTDYLIFGGWSIQVLRDFNGRVSELYWIDFSKIRTNKKCDVFFYSEDWSKSYGRVKYITYPKFNIDDVQNASSIYYFKGTKTRAQYPVPIYNASIKACMVQSKIDDFHLNELNNNFLTSKIINLNSGQPDDELRNEIERNINEKFSSSDNAGRIMISFNDSKENETTVTDLSSDDFDNRYDALAKRSASQIFTAFRATPNLFGLPTETTGFNAQEFAEAFKLFNRTVVYPIQTTVIDCLDKIFGVKGSITIKPFSLETVGEKEVE